MLTKDEALSKLRVAGQEHVLAYWDELNHQQRVSLLAQIQQIDFDEIERLTREFIHNDGNHGFAGKLEPADVIPIPRTNAGRRAARDARQVGELAIKQGRVGAVLVAGGQGTRLGFDGPKGQYAVGPVSGKSLFQLFAEQILALRMRHDAAIPWYVMTSPANDAHTRAYFGAQSYFGLPAEDVFFFQQGTVPALDPNGKLYLDRKDRIFTSPDGHGGCLKALLSSGAVTDMRRRGIDELFYFQVDNVLARICDPVFVGYHIQAGAEMSAKVVEKKYPGEKIGVIGRMDGRLTVIEYSDLTQEDKEARRPGGGLRYSAGNTAIHVLNVDFVERETEGNSHLPFHKAFKKIQHIDSAGKPVNPDRPNGYKFERFIFDALGDARTTVVMAVERREEFSPVKNAEGVDSPATAYRDQCERFARWFEAANYHVPRNGEGELLHPIEVSPRFALDADEFARKAPAGVDFDAPVYLK